MRLHHLAFRTANIDRLEAFYGRIVGLRVVQRREGSVWLASGDTLVMLEAAKAGEPPIPEASLELVAFAIGEGERASVEARLVEGGVALDGSTPFTVYVRDPDGRRVGFSSYPFEALIRATGEGPEGAVGTPTYCNSSSISSRSNQSPSKSRA